MEPDRRAHGVSHTGAFKYSDAEPDGEPVARADTGADTGADWGAHPYSIIFPDA
jgi:hypothetical protein